MMQILVICVRTHKNLEFSLIFYDISKAKKVNSGFSLISFGGFFFLNFAYFEVKELFLSHFFFEKKNVGVNG